MTFFRRLLEVGLVLVMASCTTTPVSSFTPPQVLDLAQTIKLPHRPIVIAAAQHSIWALARNAHRRSMLWRIPPHGSRVEAKARALPVHASLWTVMIGSGHDLWIAVGRRGRNDANGGVLVRFDLSQNRIASRTRIPPRPTTMTLIGRHLWMGLEGNEKRTGKILVMDASTGRLVHTIRHLTFPDIIVSGPTAVWVSSVNGDLWRVDPKTFIVKHHPGYQHVEAITRTSMWTLGKGVEQRDSRTATLEAHSPPFGCSPAYVIASERRVWAIHCVKVGPDPLPEGPPQVAEMLFAYDTDRNRTLGPPIPVGALGDPPRPLFRFGSIWWLGLGLQRIDSSALNCQVKPSCARGKEHRFTRSQ